jgi:hypothetical protein
MNSFTILKVILNQDCQLFVFRTHVWPFWKIVAQNFWFL